MNAWTAAGCIMIVVSGAIATSQAQQPSTMLSPAALKEIAEVEAEIDRIEAQTLARLTEPPNNQVQRIELLGKLMLYDKELSVNRNEACAFCHMPETGFTGPVSELNRTLRNVDKRPYPSFIKAYGHNGYFKSIKSIVHFYNTRDVLPRCSGNDPGEGITCWPVPESTANMNTKFMGRIGLSDEEENALVSFMQTLTDGFMRR